MTLAGLVELVQQAVTEDAQRLRERRVTTAEYLARLGALCSGEGGVRLPRGVLDSALEDHGCGDCGLGRVAATGASELAGEPTNVVDRYGDGAPIVEDDLDRARHGPQSTVGGWQWRRKAQEATRA